MARSGCPSYATFGRNRTNSPVEDARNDARRPGRPQCRRVHFESPGSTWRKSRLARDYAFRRGKRPPRGSHGRRGSVPTGTTVVDATSGVDAVSVCAMETTASPATRLRGVRAPRQLPRGCGLDEERQGASGIARTPRRAGITGITPPPFPVRLRAEAGHTSQDASDGERELGRPGPTRLCQVVQPESRESSRRRPFRRTGVGQTSPALGRLPVAVVLSIVIGLGQTGRFEGLLEPDVRQQTGWA